jgi:hypothetical protein
MEFTTFTALLDLNKPLSRDFFGTKSQRNDFLFDVVIEEIFTNEVSGYIKTDKNFLTIEEKENLLYDLFLFLSSEYDNSINSITKINLRSVN